MVKKLSSNSHIYSKKKQKRVAHEHKVTLYYIEVILLTLGFLTLVGSLIHPGFLLSRGSLFSDGFLRTIGSLSYDGVLP